MKAVFLDRDGTVIIDPPDLRVDSVDEIELFPDSIEALSLLAQKGFSVVFVSNQAGIGEGRFSEEQFWVIQDRVIELLKPSGINVLKTFICPHQTTDNCACHKPRPKMVLDAAREFGIDLERSYLVGDRLTDIQTGLNAGTKTILVKTGNSPVEAPQADFTAEDLLEAARYIVTHS